MKVKKNHNPNYLFLILILSIVSCNVGITFNKESIIKNERGVLLLNGNNHSSYCNVFVADKNITENNLDNFFTEREEINAEQIYINQDTRDELQIYYCRNFENEIITSMFNGDNMIFCAIPINIEYVRKKESKYLPKELRQKNYNIELQAKGYNSKRILKVNRIGEMRIIDIEPIFKKDELIKIRKKIREGEENYNKAIEPCLKRYYGIPDSVNLNRMKF